MRVLIVYSHPSNKSYTSDILRQLAQILEAEEIEYEISDLYKMIFQTDMSEQEYEREGLIQKELPISDDVKQEHNKIEYTVK